MNVTYKYPLKKIRGEVKLKLPKRHIFLKIDVFNEPVTWFIVDTDSELVEITIKGFATGEPMPNDLGMLVYLGTTNYDGFITHWFEEMND